ncbi:uncharacterized protein LOC27207290 [Drosophila simulans]|uniref:uncharacterized protein LOC27207290 n=1 Tax=Drosophila simulans TaxID=7240 RepID=UPI00078AE2EB|nr:uncharacterized protein LOC27207290 [Drosophila simulans]KMZ03030.1 uncharacterized protein Dsimw501_GD27441 [Drosophila simulans]
MNRIRRMCERLPHKLHFNFGAFLATAYKSTEFQQTRRRRRQLVGSLRRIPAGCGRLLLLRAFPRGGKYLVLRLRGQATRNIEISI